MRTKSHEPVQNDRNRSRLRLEQFGLNLGVIRAATVNLMTKHVAIWIDHREARIFHIHPEKIDELTIVATHVHHKHPRGPEDEPKGIKEDPEATKRFFHEVAQALDGVMELLLVGPSTAKLEFLRYVHKHDHALEPRIVGIETVDHPTDRQLVAYAKKYFEHSDSMQ